MHHIARKIRELRIKEKLSQAQFGSLLGVTDKAVSKWENASALPTLENLAKIRELWGISIDEMLKDDLSEKEITMIVLTGGPCAGKTTARSLITENFSKFGYKVLFVPETATELIDGGIYPSGKKEGMGLGGIEFQYELMKLQLAKEEIFRETARKMDAPKVLIVCDRGLFDSLAYITKPELKLVLNKLGLSEIEARDRYDAVFHLVTAANGAEEAYTNANNAARTETPEEAILLDNKLINAWTGHPHLRIIDNRTDFDGKMNHLLKEISHFLGEPEPYEIERKFLIKYPDTVLLDQLPNCECVQILQTYLQSSPGVERRIRQRGNDGAYIYLRTEKRPISPLVRVETESHISEREYRNLLMEADPALSPIRKTRYCLTYENQYLEIDLYPFWKDRAILEVELADADAQIKLPDYLHIIREVTDDERYKNYSLAKSHNI